jgi:hypothetical protein
MKNLLVVILLLAITVMAVAEVQVGLGTQLVQEIGTDPYFPLIGQLKWNVPVTSGFSIEARGLWETYRPGDSSNYLPRTYQYSGMAGFGYRLDDVATFALGGGAHYFDEEYIPSAYGSVTFELNYLQRIEALFTVDLDGNPRPIGAGFICSIGI